MLVHVCSGSASQGELALTLPGPDLIGPRIQADPVGLGSAGWAGFDRFLIVVGIALNMAVLTLVTPCLVLAGSSQSQTLVLAGLVMTPDCFGWPRQVMTDFAQLDLAGPGPPLVGLWPWPGLAMPTGPWSWLAQADPG